MLALTLAVLTASGVMCATTTQILLTLGALETAMGSEAAAAPAPQFTTEAWYLNPRSHFVSAVLGSSTSFVGAADTADYSPWGSGGSGYKSASLSGEVVLDPSLLLLLDDQNKTLTTLGRIDAEAILSFPSACFPSNRLTPAEVQERVRDSHRLLVLA